jgi:type 1 fimbria pilin
MSKSVAVAVKGIGIKLEDVEGYAFKFKANEFSSNTDLRNWTAQNGKYTVNFSPNFDWVNKVIDSESDE